MKKIFFIRHAKSDWSVSGLPDIDRPLNQRGYSDAHRIGAQLKKNISAQTLFVTSPAIRAMSTALIIARETGYPQGKFLICPELYEAEATDYETIIRAFDNQFDNAWIFGHNPTISEVISRFLRTDNGEISTCNVCVLKLEIINWPEAGRSKGQIEFQLSPKTLSDQSH